MAILLTGGMGYIGSHTAVEFLSAGKEIVIADNLSNSSITVLDNIEKITGARPKFYQIDVADGEALEALLAENALDAGVPVEELKALG
ncbi:MAG: SDR family NAD(P)-dependent oxidoreductase [Oscillospiraceae bacterium]|nr:SDR family NAD(P)-dependent oxidoreductase [Oscillospiraceae bacterium]